MQKIFRQLLLQKIKVQCALLDGCNEWNLSEYLGLQFNHSSSSSWDLIKSLEKKIWH